MTPAEKRIKSFNVDKFAGILITLFSLLGGFLSVKPGEYFPLFIFFILFPFLGALMWMPSDFNKINTYSVYKIDLSILFLLEKTKNKISMEHIYQILKNVNISLDYKFIPIIEEYKDKNYMDYLKKIVETRFNTIMYPHTKDDVLWVEYYLKSSKEFLKEGEKELLLKKLAFYNYE